MVERQSKHRQELERKVACGDSQRAWSGVIIGGILAAGCIGGGIWLVCIGQTTAGSAIATTSVAGLAGVFVYGTRSRRLERVDKTSLMATRRKRTPKK